MREVPNNKFQITNKLQTIEAPKKPYNLEERTFQFARDVALYCKKLSKTINNIEYAKQVIRSSGSTGANYIEANEAFSKKDFLMRIKICRKEAKESAYWFRLIIATNDEESLKIEGKILQDEGVELKKIFSSMVEKK